MNLVSNKKHTPKFPGRVLYRKVSVRCSINAECQAWEVKLLLLQFLGLFCHPWRNVRHWTTCQLEMSHQQRKSDRKYAEDFPLIFMGCKTQHLNIIRVKTLHKFLCTNCSAQHRSLCSQSWHLFWRTFPQKWIAKEDDIYIYMYATLKI